MEETVLTENKDIRLEIDYPYAVLRIDREGSKFNNFIPDLIYEMDAVLNEVEHDKKIRVLILTGNKRVFSTGVDVLHKEIREMDPSQARYFSRTGKIMFKIEPSADG